MKRVLAKRIYNGVIDNEFPEQAIYFEIEGVCIICDPYGEVDIRKCKAVEGEDVVLVGAEGESLLSDNPKYFIDLVMSSVE